MNPKVLDEDLFLLWSRVVWKNHINLWSVEVKRVKPQLVENKHGIIKLYDVKKNWWTFG